MLWTVFKKVILLLAIPVALFGQDSVHLVRGKLYIAKEDFQLLGMITGEVEDYSQSRNIIYYSSRALPGIGSLRVGRFVLGEPGSLEKSLPGSENLVTLKVRGAGHILFIMVKDRTTGQNELIRINLNESVMKRMKDVVDFELAGDEPVYITADSGIYSFYIHRNGKKLPLQVKKGPVLESVTGDRVALIRGFHSTEIIDVQSMVSISGSPADNDAQPVSYNLVCSAMSERSQVPSESRQVYFRVFIDGKEVGRTPTGPEGMELNYSVMIPPGMHVLLMERWELRKGLNKYVRANNILQPREQDIYVPFGRIIKYSIFRHSDAYIYSSETVRVLSPEQK